MPRSNKRKADSGEGSDEYAARICGIAGCVFYETIAKLVNLPVECWKDLPGTCRYMQVLVVINAGRSSQPVQ